MKTRFITILSILALTLSSCTRQSNGTMRVVNINVPQTSWSYSISPAQELDPEYKYQGNWFEASVNVPELTASACSGGLIKIYRVYDDGAQAELPISAHREEYTLQTGERYFYTETIDYEFLAGKVFFYFTASDFDYEVNETFVPDAMKFRCVIVE